MDRFCGGLLLLLFFQLALGNPLHVTTNVGRIVGGKTAPDGKYPFMVSLRRAKIHVCGASILSEEWLVTAAHCIAGFNPIPLIVVVGSNKLNEGGDSYNVIRLVKHEGYNGASERNDIGLIKVSAITFNEKVQPIALYPKYMIENVDVSIIGWGRLSMSGASPNDLQYVDVATISTETCKKRLTYIDESELCTFSGYGLGTCNGDSGGPVLRTNTNGIQFLAGIVSWGRPCAIGYPDVHTRVYSYISWIKDNCDNCIN